MKKCSVTKEIIPDFVLTHVHIKSTKPLMQLDLQQSGAHQYFKDSMQIERAEFNRLDTTADMCKVSGSRTVATMPSHQVIVITTITSYYLPALPKARSKSSILAELKV